MIIDFHTHLFSSDLCRDRTRGLEDDQFRSIYAAEKSKLIDHHDLLAAMKDYGVDFAVAMGFPWDDEELCASQNDYFRSVIELSGGTIIPFGSVPHNSARPVEEWVREIRDMGLRGVGEVGFYSRGLNEESLDFLENLLAAAKKHSLPLCIHVNEPVGHRYRGKYDPNLRVLYGILSKNQDVQIILSHWGGGLIFYELMPEVSESLAHCFYDTAASPFIYSDAIYRIAPLMVSPGKILYGSDFPLISFRRYFDAINRECGDEEWKAGVLGKNAARLLKII
ncbi:MAG TPA: TatD family hydrolase [Spirochaetota bacterium]|nr:TatD family hydrolase [Spirochaetota bacterium]HPC42152.1 TatD family hydrolase [Spirochaetota bacterium]HPL18596.1 TatD family hydrolase [Spirochaetota bacterium]HQF09676.1 TatD family hydrolase [Spirochaetota bacterium]HQH98446.1 TatD family hydrolase [Spirochaetota bacterium]